MEEIMQLGIRLHDTKKLPFEERIANVHELGFACGHLAPGKVITEFPTTDEALTPGLAMTTPICSAYFTTGRKLVIKVCKASSPWHSGTAV
jgi:hypothetical protein